MPPKSKRVGQCGAHGTLLGRSKGEIQLGIEFGIVREVVDRWGHHIVVDREHRNSGFCGTCGTGLFYRNAEFLPGIVDIQSVTLDDAQALPPGAQIQVAERLHWMDSLDALTRFERYPGME